jgi:hypothetical protein
MKLAGDYSFEASVEEVWSALMDPKVLATVMPGCEKLELVDGAYVGDLNIKVGPVQGKFSGKVDLKDVDEPRSYTMVIDGRGAPGFVKATAKITLEAVGAGTKLVYDADAQIGGKVASVGQRLVDAAARAIAKQSLDGLHENVKIRARAHREAAAKPATPEEPAPEPEVQLKPMDSSALAGAIAKEVAKSLIPKPVLYVLIAAAVGVIVWWVALR